MNLEYQTRQIRKALRLYQKCPGLILKNSSQVVEKNGQKVSSPEGRFCQTTRYIEKLPEGVYLATSDDVEGLIAQGCTWLKLLRLHEMCCDGYLRQRAKDDDILPEVADAFDYPLVTGFKYREIVKRLKRSGFEFDRQAARSYELCQRFCFDH